jgi:hypothetical protein
VLHHRAAAHTHPDFYGVIDVVPVTHRLIWPWRQTMGGSK